MSGNLRRNVALSVRGMCDCPGNFVGVKRYAHCTLDRPYRRSRLPVGRTFWTILLYFSVPFPPDGLLTFGEVMCKAFAILAGTVARLQATDSASVLALAQLDCQII